ncbi:hypothetical protein FRB94_008265 [Tulasnella sp. JGI-2019a]|nr:hypothetical protein FRB94_008265 [Tulasnella sp. JGI-2019a]
MLSRAEISSIIQAGHEPTANSVAWGLYALAQAPSIQFKLRTEVLAFPHDSPSMDELNSMPYLSNVVKEILRLRPTVPGARRMAASDIVIPLAHPIVDKDGKEIQSIFLRRGDNVNIHTFANNTRFDVWGPDALEFKPERFDKLPEAVSNIPSMFSNLAIFIAGPRGCMGYKLVDVHLKSQLFTLIRVFQFNIDPELVITTRFV